MPSSAVTGTAITSAAVATSISSAAAVATSTTAAAATGAVGASAEKIFHPESQSGGGKKGSVC